MMDYYPEKVEWLFANNHPKIIDLDLLGRFRLRKNFVTSEPEILAE